ncbi:hypothetical protein EJ04DRAFT_538838 [Polyplosphaeria fusca]|uniref:ORC6 first cyclin-like domain-containing protein n=1 Tax=Polyplosphaeria fusca TaxID=682080 RepID=A0A9P4QI04_9PLEO|nr:hypothetical protein EJ04DRAFT_538838 [Polyplosphaeria fusca]
MSRAAAEQALTGLVPALNGPLPPELVELAISLLARSRSVAQSLKPDEEIARPYACAQLACERLQKRLNLPMITSRPPCPPRIYKKLYKYLDSTLPASTNTREPNTPKKNAPQPATTPKTPLSARRTPRSAVKDNGRVDDGPEWIMPTVRTLAKVFDCPAAAPHVFAGMESTLPLLARIRPRRATAIQHAPISDVSNARILALVAAIFFYVLSRMKDQFITPEEFELWIGKAVPVLMKSAVGEDVTEDDVRDDIEPMMSTAREEGWLQMEWLVNVVSVEDGDEDVMEGVEMTNAPAKKLQGDGGEHIGLGTMMQDATDYLSEANKADYRNWKKRMVTRIKEIEEKEVP